jgi:hypothetical protein
MKRTPSLSNKIWRNKRISLTFWSVGCLVVLMLMESHAYALTQPTSIKCDPVENVDNQVRVGWQDKSSDETGHRVQRRVNSGGWSDIADITADSTEFTDIGLNASTTYRYRVAPLDGSTVGPYSDVCRKPLILDSVNDHFRVYYRPYTAVDAPLVDGQQMFVPTTTNAAGDNEYAARIVGILEDSRDGFLNVGFDDVAFYDNGPLLPVNLAWCDGGGYVLAPVVMDMTDTDRQKLRHPAAENKFFLCIFVFEQTC